MIDKLILTGAYDFGDPAVELVRIHRGGVELTGQLKQAGSQGVFHKAISQLKPKKNQTVIHLIAVGDEERFGPNRNCDGFSREDNVTAHRYFKDIGHVFKHHRNSDPAGAVGEVLDSGHNGEMSRIELLIGLDNDKCRNEVQSLECGEDLAFSMGSSQAYDVCSICNHRAPTAQDHCDHVKNQLGLVMDDGRRVYMKNPKPKYFDISVVFKPADRIAYMLRKVAADNSQVLGGHQLAEMYGLTSCPTPKLAAMRALAHMYKQIPLTVRKATSPTTVRPGTMAELKKKAAVHGLDKLLGFLHENGWLLGPSDFGQLIGHKDPQACESAVEHFSDMDELLSDHTEISALAGPSYVEDIPLSCEAEADLQQSCCMEAGPADQRVIRISIINPGAKTAGVIEDTAEARGLAALYGHYKLAFAAYHYDRPELLRRLAATF